MTRKRVVAACVLLSLATAAIAWPRQAAEWYDELESASVGVKWLRFSILDFFGSCVVCHAYRVALMQHGAVASVSWFETLVSCTAGQFGGTTLVGLLLGQPPSWACSHNAFRSLIVAWWLTFCCPRDAWHRLLRTSWWAKLAIGLGAWMSTGHAISSWGAEKAVNAQHEQPRTAVFATLIAGTLGACGGTLFAATFNHRRTFRGDFGGVRKAAVGSVLYYILRDPHDIIGTDLAPETARLLIGFYSISASLPLLVGIPASRTPHAFLERLFCTLLNIPDDFPLPEKKKRDPPP